MPTARNPYERQTPLPAGQLAVLVASTSGQAQERKRSIKAETVKLRGPHQSEIITWALSGYDLFGTATAERPQGLRAPTKSPASQEPSLQPRIYLGRSISEPKSDATWLEDALEELENVGEVATEEDLPPPSDTSKENARRIINELVSGPYPEPTVYPTEDGEVAILFQKRSARAAVLILCYYDGGGAWFSTFPDERHRAKHEDASKLPDASLKVQLLKLRVA